MTEQEVGDDRVLAEDIKGCVKLGDLCPPILLTAIHTQTDPL